MPLPHSTTYTIKLILISVAVFCSYLSGQIPLLQKSVVQGRIFHPQKVLAVKTYVQEKPQEKEVFLGGEVKAYRVVRALTPTPIPQQAGSSEWGVAKQVDEHTWTMRVGMDDRMATPSEIYEALNAFRQKNGRGGLAWDDKLAGYAQSRSGVFASIKSTDGHAGFQDYLNNQDGFHKLGFNSIGENSSFGYRVYGVHLIEWIYAGDAPHNNNQLNPQWTHVGIGVADTGTDLIFGGNKQ
ncbi:MAG: CAP domain-containing protein [Candidatus Levybacteria bacterium]|nr:CAP domain-containing protein [Candidatus Levybacteria bacterium]